MFKNIGGKIKTLAKVLCWVGIIGSSIGGVCLLPSGYPEAVFGVVIAIGGSLIFWIGSFVLYGFGQLVENSEMIRVQNSKIIGENTNLTKYKGGTTSTEESEGTSTTVPEHSHAKTESPIDDTPAKPGKEKCDFCFSENVEVKLCKYVDAIGTHYYQLCSKCQSKYHATPLK